MNQAQYANGGVEVSLRTGAKARVPSGGLQPIPNTDRERVKTLDDLALSNFTLSDFPTVERWRKALFQPDGMPELCGEFPRHLTEYLRDHEHLRPYRRRCGALAYVFSQKTAIVRPNDLLPGQTTTSFVGPVVYADMIGYCIWPELKTLPTRPQNPFKVRPEVARTLSREVFPYWLERRVVPEVARYSDYDTAAYANDGRDRVEGGMFDGQPSIDPPLKKRAGETPKAQDLFERVAFFLSDKATCVSHTVPDFERLLTHGLDGLIEQMHADLQGAAAGNRQRTEFLEGVITVLEGVKTYAAHLAEAAEAAGNQELARICQKVPAQPAETLHEALVSVWICYHLLLLENTNFGFSIGRMDQWLNRFYLADWEKLGSPEARAPYVARAVELVSHFFLRCSDHVPLSTEGAEKLFAGSGSNQALTVGGTRYGDGKIKNAVNDMTYIILKAAELLAIRDPNVHARYHKDVHGRDAQGNPLPADQCDPYLQRLCEVNILTRATPAIHGDAAAVAAMAPYYAAHEGVPEAEALADAHDYASIGCIEQNSGGRHYGNSGSTLFVLPAVLELTLYGGKHRSDGVGDDAPNLFTGAREYTTKPLTDMRSMDEFVEAFRFQLDQMARHAVQNNNYLGRFLEQVRPSPLLSSLFVGPTNLPGQQGASFRDLASGGAKYNSAGVAIIGLADVIDSFCVIENLVFSGKVPAAELLAAVDAQFDASQLNGGVGQSWWQAFLDTIRRWFGADIPERLQPQRLREINQVIRHAPKYGAGVDQTPGGTYDNALAVKYTHLLPELIREVFYKYRTHRGGRYLVGYWSMTNHAGFGMLTKATPNGRPDGASFASGITPAAGIVKRNGEPVILLDHMLSVAEVEPRHVQNGYTYNLSLTTRDRADFAPDTRAFADYMRTFLQHDGMLAQMCVSSIRELEAAHAAATAASRPGAGADAQQAMAPFKDLMIRVAGYSAYFVTLSPQMRQEIIDRSNFALADGVEQHTVSAT